MIKIQEILENVYTNCQARSKEVSLQKLSKVLQSFKGCHFYC